MPGPEVEALLYRMAVALDEFKPQVPAGRVAVLVVLNPEDVTDTVLLGGVGSDTLLRHLQFLEVDDGREQGVVNAGAEEPVSMAPVNRRH